MKQKVIKKNKVRCKLEQISKFFDRRNYFNFEILEEILLIFATVVLVKYLPENFYTLGGATVAVILAIILRGARASR